MILEGRDSVNNGYLIATNIIFKYYKGFNIHPQNIKEYFQSLELFLLLSSTWISSFATTWGTEPKPSQAINRALVAKNITNSHYLNHFTNSSCFIASHKVLNHSHTWEFVSLFLPPFDITSKPVSACPLSPCESFKWVFHNVSQGCDWLDKSPG